MLARRIIFALLLLGIAAGVLALAGRAVLPGGITPWEWLALAALAGNAIWLGISGAHALLGLVILLASRDAPGLVLPAARRAAPDARAPTIIAMCIRHEAMEAIIPALRRLMAGLPAEDFTLWLLSDSQDPAAIAAEEAAIAALPGARYRRRTQNTGFKAGNVMQFLDHHAGDARYLICLDADSEMSAATIRRLVAIMEADDKLAIVQPLIAGRPVAGSFPRLFQFGMRAGMRAWATGQAWWQGPAGPYWGHNAIIRIAPFRAHARLETLPDGSHVLSHDQVEAARLTAAGWKVMVLPDDAGSLSGNPPALPEFLARDRRWGAGNMQYWALLRLPGLSWMGRWQLAQAILLFLAAPFWALLLLACVMNAATGGGQGTDSAYLAAAMLAAWGAQNAPKLAGYAHVLARRELAARHGGRGFFARGAGLEMLHGLVLEAVSFLDKAVFLAALPFRRRMGWGAQNRTARGLGWGAAARLLWPHLLLGLACFALVPPAAWPWLLPWAGPLLAAIPFAVLTAREGLAIAATPEELQHA